jgi:hypothetical protein
LKRLISIINHGVCSLFFAIAAWQVVQKAMTLKNAGELSETLRIIYYPFTMAVAFGCFVLALALFTDCLTQVFVKNTGAK